MSQQNASFKSKRPSASASAPASPKDTAPIVVPQLTTNDPAELRARDAERKFHEAQKRKEGLVRKVQEYDKAVRNSASFDGIKAGHVQRLIELNERRALMQDVWQAERDEETLFLEMQLARQAFKKAKAERVNEAERHKAELAALNAEKDRLDESNKARRAHNALLARQSLEEQHRTSQAALNDIELHRKLSLDKQSQRRAQQAMEFAAKRQVLEDKSSTLRQQAILRRESYHRNEQARLKLLAANAKHIYELHNKLQRKVADLERRLATARETFQQRHATQHRNEDEDEEILNLKHLLHKAAGELSRAQLEAHDRQASEEARQAASMLRDQQEVDMLEKQALEQALRDQRELEAFEEQQRKSEWQNQLTAEQLDRESTLYQQKIETLSKLLQAARQQEDKAREDLTEAERQELDALMLQKPSE